MPEKPRVLKLVENDGRTVVGFGESDFYDTSVIQACCDELNQLAQTQPARAVTIDLTGRAAVPSTVLGMLLSLHQRGVDIELKNPSHEMRHILQFTRLDTRFRVQPEGPADAAAE